MFKHVIVGNGGAAISAVRAITKLRPQDDITLVSKENCPAYSPALTPYYIAGRIPYEGMFICHEAFYKENGVRTRLGHTVVRVDPGSKAVFLDNGESIPYDNLLVATGSSTAVPPIPGANCSNVFTLWRAEEARKIREAGQGAQRVTIVGAGLIGIQSLGVMMSLGKKVSLVEVTQQVMPTVLDEEGASILQERLRSSGVDVRLNDTVLAIEQEAGRLVLSLASGSQIETDMVLLATGVRPNVEPFAGSGVRIAGGALVDEWARTNIDGIYAAGDVAEPVDPITGKSQINATWINAVEQGRIAGLNMCGRRVPHPQRVSRNIFTALGLQCASIGLVRGGESHEVISRRNGEVYRKLVFEGDRLVGVLLAGEVGQAGILASLIERRLPYPHVRGELMRHKAFVGGRL